MQHAAIGQEDSQSDHSSPSEYNSDDVMTSDGDDSRSSLREEGAVSSDSDDSYSSLGSEGEEDVGGTSRPTTIDLPFGERVAAERVYHKDGVARKRNGVDKEKVEKTENTEKGGRRMQFKREHKHRPVEMSSKRPVSVLRDSTLGLGDGSGIVKKKRGRDPRFDSLSGKYSEKAFKKRYSFVFDEKLPEERQELKETISKVKSETKKEKLQRKLQRITQQLKTEEARRKQETRRQKVLDAHWVATKGQTKKYHLKKSDIKKQELLLKYQELKDSGQLDKYMEKRRKKNAAKDHRYLPFRKQ